MLGGYRLIKNNCRQRIKDNKGVEIVEFALVFPVYLLVILMVMELAWLFGSELILQHAVREGTRMAVTQPRPRIFNPDDRQEWDQLAERIRTNIRQNTFGIIPASELNNIVIQSRRLDSDPNDWRDFAGLHRDVLRVRADFSWRPLDPLLAYLLRLERIQIPLRAQTVMRNEPR